MITKDNRTLLFGEGLFETINWRGITKKVRLHYERLRLSSAALSIHCPDYDEFASHLLEATNGVTDKNVKYCLFSKGNGVYYEQPEGYEYEIIIRDLPTIPSSVKLTYSPFNRHSKDPVIYHKTMNYTFNIFVKRDAIKRGFYDAVVLNEKGMITECSSSNIIILKGSHLYSPTKDSGILMGTCLSVFANHKVIDFKSVCPDDMKGSDSIFLVNSITGVLPVSKLNEDVFAIDKDACKFLNDILIKENTSVD